MKKIAITGLSGVIGGLLVKELSGNKIIDLYHTKKYNGNAKIARHLSFDLEDTSNIQKNLKTAQPDVIIHLAAITHIDRCEEDRKAGRDGKVWKINVEATSEIAKYASKNHVQLIFLSTECVFDGKKKYFSESARKNPLSWYGVTKSEAEKAILSSKAHAAIIRSVVAYHKNDGGKTIYGKILKDLSSKHSIDAVSDRFFTPTHTQDIIRAINIVVEQNLKGIFHVAPAEIISPFDMALMIAKANNISPRSVKKVKLSSYYSPKRASLRLKNASLMGKKTNKMLKFIPQNPEEVI